MKVGFEPFPPLPPLGMVLTVGDAMLPRNGAGEEDGGWKTMYVDTPKKEIFVAAKPAPLTPTFRVCVRQDEEKDNNKRFLGH